MQTPIRYYITKSDDQPVVRSIPVTVRPNEAAAVSASPAPSPGVNEQPLGLDQSQSQSDGQREPRVRRFVRSAMGR